jgi:hypothetical protein
MTCSTSVQIYKKMWWSESICFEGQTELSNSVFTHFRFLLKQVAIFEMLYLLDYWDLECACHPYYCGSDINLPSYSAFRPRAFA